MPPQNALLRVLATPFGLGVLACLVLAGWALWSGGVLDGAMARTVRTSSVYAAPGLHLNTATAQQIIGNRRLVVIMLEPGADLRAGCHAVKRAAAGTLVVLLSRAGDDYDTYGCSLFSGGDKHIGDAVVAETMIGNGIDEFIDRPLDAIKVIAVNFDQLVEAGVLSGESRTISPSLPRYLIAGAAIGAVLIGAALLYGMAWRTGRLAAARRERRDRATDSRTMLSAATAAVAQQIIDLDRGYATAVRNGSAGGQRQRTGSGKSTADYRAIASEYTQLLDDIARADQRGDQDFSALTGRAESLAGRLRAVHTPD